MRIRFSDALAATLIFAASFTLGCNGCDRRGSASPTTKTGSPTSPKAIAAAATNAMTVGLVEWKKTPRDCTRVVDVLAPALQVEATRETEESFYALAECARETKRWSVVKAAMLRILRADPDYPHHALLPRAEIGLGNTDAAIAELEKLMAAAPNDPELVLTQSIADATQSKWEAALAAAEQALKLALTSKLPEQPLFNEEANIECADALLHLGRLDDASSAVDAAEKLGGMGAVIAGLRNDLALAQSTSIVIDEFHQREIPLGIYHLYDKVKDAGSVVALVLSNLADTDRTFRVDTEVTAVTRKASQTKTIKAGAHELIRFAPRFLDEFKPALVRSDLRTQLLLTVTAVESSGDRLVFDESFPVTVLTHDALPLQVQTGEDTTRPAYIFLAAWMTPKDKAVHDLINSAKKLAPEGAFPPDGGPGGDAMQEVKALYDELRTKGIVFGMDASCAPALGTVQVTRLPAELLAEGADPPSCLEGPLLFATLLEALGIRPLFVMTPIHAWVGWHASHDEGARDSDHFLDTTGVHDFKSALEAGQRSYGEEARYKHFDQALSFLIDVTALRQAGVTPQKWQ